MKGNSSSGYDDSMKVVRDPGKNGRTESFFFREKLGRGAIKRENQAEVWADDHTKMQVVASDRTRRPNVLWHIRCPSQSYNQEQYNSISK